MVTKEEKTSNLIYLVVKHNTICEESKTEKAGFEPVEVFNPKTKEKQTKWIDPWGAITGFIVAIDPYDTENTYETRYRGFKLNLDDEVILDLPQKTPAYDAFCKSAENIDFTKEVKLSAYHNKAKDRTGFSISQGGQNVAWKYTKDNPEDCPPWETNEDGELDSSKQRVFLKNKVIDVVIPKCQAATAARKIESPLVEEEAPATTEVAEAPKASAATAIKGKGKAKPESDQDIPF